MNTLKILDTTYMTFKKNIFNVSFLKKALFLSSILATTTIVSSSIINIPKLKSYEKKIIVISDEGGVHTRDIRNIIESSEQYKKSNREIVEINRSFISMYILSKLNKNAIFNVSWHFGSETFNKIVYGILNSDDDKFYVSAGNNTNINSKKNFYCFINNDDLEGECYEGKHSDGISKIKNRDNIKIVNINMNLNTAVDLRGDYIVGNEEFPFKDLLLEYSTSNAVPYVITKNL